MLWTCFFPASQQILSLLSLDGIREEKLLREEFEAPITGVPRIVEKELGGSTVLDIGCYVIHFACMVFRGEKPKSITASGFLCPTGNEAVGVEVRSTHRVWDELGAAGQK